MKELKFRAHWKSLDKVRHFSTGYIQCGHKDFETGILFPLNKNESGVYLSSCEVMQYTGLKDKNGKEIYEGDIVTISRYHPEEVLYEVTVEDIRRIPEEFYGSNFNWSEVTGNIFEKKEELGRIPAPQSPHRTTNA